MTQSLPQNVAIYISPSPDISWYIRQDAITAQELGTLLQDPECAVYGESRVFAAIQPVQEYPVKAIANCQSEIAGLLACTPNIRAIAEDLFTTRYVQHHFQRPDLMTPIHTESGFLKQWVQNAGCPADTLRQEWTILLDHLFDSAGNRHRVTLGLSEDQKRAKNAMARALRRTLTPHISNESLAEYLCQGNNPQEMVENTLGFLSTAAVSFEDHALRFEQDPLQRTFYSIGQLIPSGRVVGKMEYVLDPRFIESCLTGQPAPPAV